MSHPPLTNAARVLGTGIVHGLGELANMQALAAAGAVPALHGVLPEPDTASLTQDLPGVSLRRVPRYARMALLAAVRALCAADVAMGPNAGKRPFVPDRTALVIGSAWCGVQTSMDFMDSILDNGPHLSSPTAFSHAVNNVGAGLVSLSLGLRGPCCTVTQFELSFAGALETGLGLLAAERADMVLVGAVDETDPRFFRVCPVLAPAGPAPAAGAIFFCLDAPALQPDKMGGISKMSEEEGGKAAAGHSANKYENKAPGGPFLTLDWGKPAEKHGTALLLSGAAQAGDQGRRLDALYGHTPLAQALDVALAPVFLRPETSIVNCLCRETSRNGKAGASCTVTVHF